MFLITIVVALVLIAGRVWFYTKLGFVEDKEAVVILDFVGAVITIVGGFFLMNSLKVTDKWIGIMLFTIAILWGIPALWGAILRSMATENHEVRD